MVEVRLASWMPQVKGAERSRPRVAILSCSNQAPRPKESHDSTLAENVFAPRHARRPVLPRQRAVGRRRIDGEFNWSEIPQSLTVPSNTGLIDARFDGRALGWPDASGQLWLRKTSVEAASADELTVRAFRRIDDEIPQLMTTQLELSVAGKPREVRLPSVLLAQFIPVAVSSPLPARCSRTDRYACSCVRARGRLSSLVGRARRLRHSCCPASPAQPAAIR